MWKLRVNCFSVSLDGYGAGPSQDLKNPLGVGDGVSTIRQYLSKRLIDEMHLAVAPVLMGRGENLFAGLDLPALGYQTTGLLAGPGVTHITVKRK